MLSLLRWRRPVRTRLYQPVRLGLERLEGRETPAAPVISSVDARILGNHLIVTGMVQDESPGTVNVNLGGSVSATVSPSSTGYFQYITGYTDSTATITGSATDNESLTSGSFAMTVFPPLENQAPFITLGVSYGTQRTVTLSGVVYDESPGGLTVTITGSAGNYTATTNSSGNYSITVTANSLGNVNAVTADGFGLGSNTALIVLQSNVPVISNFTITEISPGVFRVRGQVTDESAPGLVVHLSGEVDALRGKTITVASDCWFEATYEINNPQDEGMVFAEVTDWWGLKSEAKEFILDQ